MYSDFQMKNKPLILTFIPRRQKTELEEKKGTICGSLQLIVKRINLSKFKLSLK